MIWLYTLAAGVDRQREADALVSAGTRRDGRIDADYLAAHIEQGTAAIARIDGCVGLQEVLELAVGLADFRRTCAPWR